MNDLDPIELQARSMGDQVASHMRANLEGLRMITKKDPTEWTIGDARLIQATISGVIGFIYEGRI